MSIVLDLPADLSPDDYVAIGMATCFQRKEDVLDPLHVLEPIPSAYLAVLYQQVPTAYQWVMGTTLKDLPQILQNLPVASELPVQLGADFVDRAIAAARTYQGHPPDALLPGMLKTDLNYSIEKKRILNLEIQVKPEDNVRQHEYTHQKL